MELFKLVLIIFCTLMDMIYALDKEGHIFANMYHACHESCNNLFPVDQFPYNYESAVTYLFYNHTYLDASNNHYTKNYFNWLWSGVDRKSFVMDAHVFSVENFCNSYRESFQRDDCKVDLTSRGFLSHLSSLENFQKNIFRLFFEVSLHVVPPPNVALYGSRPERKKSSVIARSLTRSATTAENRSKKQKEKKSDFIPITILTEPEAGQRFWELYRKEGLEDFTEERLKKETPPKEIKIFTSTWNRPDFTTIKKETLNKPDYYKDYMRQAPYEVDISSRKILGLFTPELFCKAKICEHLILASLPACPDCDTGNDYGKLIFLYIDLRSVDEKNTIDYINYLGNDLTSETITPQTFCENSEDYVNSNSTNKITKKKFAFTRLFTTKKIVEDAGDNFPIHKKKIKTKKISNTYKKCYEYMVANSIVVDDVMANLKRLYFYSTKENTTIGPIDDKKTNFLFQYMEFVKDKLIFNTGLIYEKYSPFKFCSDHAKSSKIDKNVFPMLNKISSLASNDE